MAKSKVAEMKEEMMWQKKGPMCSNCKHFTSEKKEKSGYYGTYVDERKKRCTRGGFATGKSCWCADHEFK